MIRIIPLAFVTLLHLQSTYSAVVFTRLGDLAGGSFSSHALKISADGSTVIGYSTSAAGSEAFRWTASGGMVSIGAGSSSIALGVSGDGGVIVGDTSPSPFRWTQSTGSVNIGHFNPSFPNDNARAVSADGTTIVGEGGVSVSTLTSQAYRWTESGGFEGLGFLAGGQDRSTARAVSADGSVVVGRGSSTAGTEAFRWTASGGMVGLGDLAGGSVVSVALGVSADGQTVVGQGRTASGNEAFRWTQAEGMVGLGFPTAYAISGDGSTIVGGGSGAVIWDSTNGVRSVETIVEDAGIDLTGWDLLSVRGVSHDGQSFVGIADNPDGEREAWLVQLNATAVPEPRSFLIIFATIFAVSIVRWKSQSSSSSALA